MMNFLLVGNWREIIKRAWSFRLALLSGFLSAIAAAMPFAAPPYPSFAFAAALFLVSSAAAVAGVAAAAARLVYQQKIHTPQ